MPSISAHHMSWADYHHVSDTQSSFPQTEQWQSRSEEQLSFPEVSDYQRTSQPRQIENMEYNVHLKAESQPPFAGNYQVSGIPLGSEDENNSSHDSPPAVDVYENQDRRYHYIPYNHPSMPDQAPYGYGGEPRGDPNIIVQDHVGGLEDKMRNIQKARSDESLQRHQLHPLNYHSADPDRHALYPTNSSKIGVNSQNMHLNLNRLQNLETGIFKQNRDVSTYEGYSNHHEFEADLTSFSGSGTTIGNRSEGNAASDHAQLSGRLEYLEPRSVSALSPAQDHLADHETQLPTLVEPALLHQTPPDLYEEEKTQNSSSTTAPILESTSPLTEGKQSTAAQP